MKYYVRKSWEDIDSQIGEYDNINNVIGNCPYPYNVFDENGNLVIGTADLSKRPPTKLYRANHQKMWDRLKEKCTDEVDFAENVPFHLSYEKTLEARFYSKLLKVMEEIENEETIVIQEVF